MQEALITCDPGNRASARSCELAGGALLGSAEIPPEHPLYREGKRRVLVYRFYPVSSSPVAAFAAADALAKRNLNQHAAALGRRPRLFRLIRSRRLPAALPTGETLLSLTFKRSGTKALSSLTLATA